MESEQEAMEEMALADLAAEMGMAVEGESSSGGDGGGGTAETTKSMGGEESESA